MIFGPTNLLGSKLEMMLEFSFLLVGDKGSLTNNFYHA